MLTRNRTRHHTHLKVVRTLVHRVALDRLPARQVDSMALPAVLPCPRWLQPLRSRSQRIASC